MMGSPGVREPSATCLRSAGGHAVPLLGVELSGDVYGAHARIVVRQRYRNDEESPIEAIYTFPLPSDAVVVGFAMECAGRRMESEVREREEAFKAFDEAVAKGHGAALLEEERKNVFTANVGNLMPGEETMIEVAFVQRLTSDEGALRLMIPTLVAPRYIPGAAIASPTGHGTSAPTDRVPDADRITPRIAAVKYGLSLDVRFDLGRAITLESPSHAIAVEAMSGGVTRVRFERDEVALDRDLVLLAAGAPGVVAGLVADKKRGEEGTFALTVVPDLFEPSERAAAHDVLFVVDVSGSMEGDSIEQARAAMRLCLRHLAEGDRFGIIAFSDTFRWFEQKLVPFTKTTLASADTWIARLSAGGGTEMLEPLLAATGALGDTDRDRVIVLLTDGQVGNEEEIVRRVVAEAKGTRVYTFGIGTNVSDLLLRGLARRTNAVAEFIHPGERIDEKVTAQFARATAARVDGVTLKLEGLDGGELTPAELPSLVDGEPWVVYGRYEESSIGHATLRGTLRGKPFHLRIPVELPTEVSRDALGALWAGGRIRDLEDAESELSGRRQVANRDRIVALATRHGVSSRHTSFVVVEKRFGDRRAKGHPETRVVPVSAPAGWQLSTPGVDVMSAPMGGMGGGYGAASATLTGATRGRAMVGGSYPTGAPPPPPQMAAPAPAAAKAGGIAGVFSRAMNAVFGEDRGEAFEVFEAEHGDAPSPPSAAPDSIAAWFQSQGADGAWSAPDDTSDLGSLRATTKVLLACIRAGIDTAHAVYGHQLKKAVEATCVLADTLASKDPRAGVSALLAAFVVASGARARARVSAVVHDNGALGAYAESFTSVAAARAKLDELEP